MSIYTTNPTDSYYLDVTKDREFQRALANRDSKHTAMIANITDVIAILDD